MNAAPDTQKLRECIENIPVGVCVYQCAKGEIRCVAANNRYAAMLGEQKSEILGGTLDELFARIHPEEREECKRELMRLFHEKRSVGGSFRISLKNAPQQYLWSHWDGRLADCPEGGQLAYFTCTDIEESMQLKEELERSRQAMNSVVRHVPGGVFVYSAEADEEFSFVSENALAMLGYTEKEFREKFGNKFSQMVYQEDREATLRSIEEQIAEGAFDSCIYRIEKKDGTLMRVQDEGHLVTDENGKQWFYVVIVDITASEREREYNFHRAVEELLLATPNALCTFRLNLTKNLCSGGHTSSDYIRKLIAADTVDELLQKVADSMVDPVQAAAFLDRFTRPALLAQFQRGKERLEVSYRRPTDSGEVHWITTYFHLLQNPYNQDVETIAYSVDSDRAHKEAQIVSLLTHEEYDCIGLINSKNHKITYYYVSESYKNEGWSVSERFEERTDAIVEKLPGMREKQEFLAQVSLDMICEALKTKSVYTCAYSGKGSRKQVTFRYLEKGFPEIMFALNDITESFEHEEAYAQQMRMALKAAEQASIAKTEFLSRMSHEICTPMNAIIGLDAIALQEKGLSAATEDHLQKIGISARFLLSLINDILDMSRIESGKMALRNEIFHFEEFINGINTIMYEQCRASGLDYECVLKGFTEENYVGDKTKLQQVLINILGNSVKFTPKGGKIHLMVEQLSGTKTKARLRFEISDTGIGIDEEFIPHLFEVFTQENRGRNSSYGGTGLGLAISKNIVRLMDGEIAVHSIKGVGSEFTVEVDMGLPKEVLLTRERRQKTALLPLRTLVVDDDVIVCRHTQMLLCSAGLKAEWVASGEEAVAEVKEHKKTGTNYDLILLDWKMPDMDGIETARLIREEVGPEVTIIIMTAYDWADIEDKARAAGVDLFMKKPVFVSSVTRAFEKVFLQKLPESEMDQSEKFDFSGRRVLLAEDNEINAEIAKSILEMKNCTVEVAENGVAAIEAFSVNPVGYFDAILMDIRMPVMDGLEATRAIRAMKKQDGKTIPILAMTANAFQEDVDAAMQSGMNAHLSKPIEPQLLYETLTRYIKK